LSKIQAPIDLSPEIAAAIGRLVAHWGILEDLLTQLLQNLLGVDQFRADMVFNTFPALGQKIGLIERLLYSFAEANATRTTALSFCKRAKALSETRNKFIHASWAGDGTSGELVIFSKALPNDTKKRISQPPIVTAQDIQIEVDKVAALSGEMQIFGTNQALGKQPKLVIRRQPLA
jgi:hypothetical protein